jgi:hypothetical protein
VSARSPNHAHLPSWPTRSAGVPLDDQEKCWVLRIQGHKAQRESASHSDERTRKNGVSESRTKGRLRENTNELVRQTISRIITSSIISTLALSESSSFFSWAVFITISYQLKNRRDNLTSHILNVLYDEMLLACLRCH